MSRETLCSAAQLIAPFLSSPYYVRTEKNAFKNDLRKIMLTVFKHNEVGIKFFKGSMKYEIDETSPVDDLAKQYDYEILSGFNKRKLECEASEREQTRDKKL